LSLSEKYEIYAKKVLDLLENHEIRALVDNRNETIGKKIRDAEMQKIPFMLIVGEEEEKMGLFLSVVMDKKEKEISLQ
jgi:threonyl-tRNA synthetase